MNLPAASATTLRVLDFSVSDRHSLKAWPLPGSIGR